MADILILFWISLASVTLAALISVTGKFFKL